MADEIDVASCLIDNELSRALEKIRQNASQVTAGATHCVECGDAMPAERQKLGFKLCVPCAQEAERRQSLYATDY